LGCALTIALVLAPLPCGAGENQQVSERAGGNMLNMPPEGFTALFNGEDFTGWQLSPMAKEAWFIEDGVLKSHKGMKDWGADLHTVKRYRDYVLLADYRMPSISDSGIYIRGLIPRLELGRLEQIQIIPGGTGYPMCFNYLTPDIKLKESQYPRVKRSPRGIGTWHTIKLTLVGRMLTVEFDGQTVLDRYEYPEEILSTAPSVIGLQKHAIWEMAGKMRDMPIEFRNVFIKEIASAD